MRRRGQKPTVVGSKLRELREAVRFTDEPYPSIAPRFGLTTGMGVLKAARRYERDNGLTETQREDDELAHAESAGQSKTAPIPLGDTRG